MPSEQKRTEDMALELLQQIHSEVSATRTELATHVAEEPRRLAEAVEAAVQQSMSRAFPAGDPEGHRKAHEAAIAHAEARAAFWQKMLFEVTKYGLFGVLGWLAYVVWTAFIQGPKQ